MMGYSVTANALATTQQRCLCHRRVEIRARDGQLRLPTHRTATTCRGAHRHLQCIERAVPHLLTQLEIMEPGHNWLNPKLNGISFGLNQTWVKAPPKAGPWPAARRQAKAGSPKGG